MTTLDQRFQAFVRAITHAEVIDDLPPATFSGQKADYLLYERGVVAEVKYLTEDRGKTIREKLDQLAESDPLFPQIFGTVHVEEVMAKHGDPERFRRMLCDYAGRTLHSLIRNANKQIADTKTALNLERSTGLLILLNEGVQLYDDDFVYQEVSRILHRKSGPAFERRHVECVWYLNEYRAETKRVSSSVFVGPSLRNASAETMLNMLQTRWAAHNGYAVQA